MELQAMARIDAVLDGVPDDCVQRVLGWVMAKHGGRGFVSMQERLQHALHGMSPIKIDFDHLRHHAEGGPPE